MTNEEIPPYLEFSRRAIEDRAASMAAGHYVARDVDFVSIQRPGSRDVHEEEVATYFEKYRNKVRGKQAPASWLQMFESNYSLWKQGLEIPLVGSPLRGWPLLSPSQLENLLRAKVRTVEELAALPESELQHLGFGIVTLRLKAQEWLLAGSEKGVQVEKLAHLARENSELKAALQKLAEEFKTLRDSLPESA